MTASLFVWWAKYALIAIALMEFVFLAWAMWNIMDAERKWRKDKRESEGAAPK